MSNWRLAPGGHLVRIVDEALARLIATDVVGRLESHVDPADIRPGLYLVATCWGRRGRRPLVAFVVVGVAEPGVACDLAVTHVRRTRGIHTDIVIEATPWRVVASDDAVPG